MKFLENKLKYQTEELMSKEEEIFKLKNLI